MKASHLHLAYGTKVIYDDCNFHFEAGDKVGVIGVNGAGKTTLFRIILGQQQLDDGEIDFGNNLRLGYLPQEITIPPEHADITVWDYVASGRPVDDLQAELNQEYEKLAKYPDSEKILDRITKLQDLIDSYDLANFDYELLKILDKMNLGELSDRKMRELSGGQKSKVAFARVLFENAGLLLLDEPTNHLDVETKSFVMNFLRHYPGTVLVISHDIEFLDAVTNKTLFVNKTTHKMKVYKGNYSDFRREYAAEKAAEDARITEQEREIKRLSEFVARARAAKRSNTALIGMGHQREKVLAKKLEALETREREYAKVALNIAPAKLSGRTPLEVQNLTFAYGGGPLLYDRLSFSLDRGEKFLIVGENGVGKSTLLKLIVGQLHPLAGSVIFSKHTTIAYYAQELEILDERRTILENVASYDFTDTELRSALSNFLFYGDDVDKKVSVLSPGEKARVALCKILLQRANLIILDEPTNHFDPDTQKIIGENLKDYPGTIIMVSHNPAFVEQIGVTRMLIVPSRHNQDLPAEATNRVTAQPTKSKLTKTGDASHLPVIKNYSHELLEYYYYLNSDLI
jgi:ATP-binding cassette subfamily F protein 3